jgi:hypothetical protein
MTAPVNRIPDGPKGPSAPGPLWSVPTPPAPRPATHQASVLRSAAALAPDRPTVAAQQRRADLPALDSRGARGRPAAADATAAPRRFAEALPGHPGAPQDPMQASPAPPAATALTVAATAGCLALLVALLVPPLTRRLLGRARWRPATLVFLLERPG